MPKPSASGWKEVCDETARRTHPPQHPHARPYSTARDEYGGQRIDVWLDANESPYDNGVNRYPDPRQQRLREMLAARKGIAADRIFIGSGSDEAIDLAYRIFCRPGIDNAVSIAPTYGMYRVAAAVNDVELRSSD